MDRENLESLDEESLFNIQNIISEIIKERNFKKGDLETKDKSEEKKLADKSSKSTESLFNPGPTDPESNDEVTVDFNTQEFKYISYFLRIKRKIEMTWSYPTSSLQRGETGQVVLKITLNKKGKLINSEILKSSGYADLDNCLLYTSPSPRD